jgi:hypothetical protein
VITGGSYSDVQNLYTTFQGRSESVWAGTKLYTGILRPREHRENRNHNNCGSPIWCQMKRERWSAGTSNWDEAMRNAPAEPKARNAGKKLTPTKAVNLYWIESEQADQPCRRCPLMTTAGCCGTAPDGGRGYCNGQRKMSSPGWQTSHSADVDRWRNTWSFGKSPTSRGSGLGSGAKDTLTRPLTRPADVLPGWIFNQNGLREMAVDYFG